VAASEHEGSSAAVAANQEVVPIGELRAAQQRIRELERALGQKTMEVEILQAAWDEVKKDSLLRRVQEVTGRKMAPICRTLGISRACAYRKSVGRPARYARAEDRVVTAQIRTVIRTRATGISRSTIERGIAELERENPVLEAD
jgi:hypothetical protein